MRKFTAYDIYDRRTQDQIDERTLDEAIKNHIKSDIALETYDDDSKIGMLVDAGFIVRPMPFITTGEHQSGRAGKELNPYEECVQVDFNYPDESVSIDLHMEEHLDNKYFCISFFPKEEGIIRKMFDREGNEKVIEMCPHCGEEVPLDALKKIKQPCPKCGKQTLACCLCEDGERDCRKCEGD